MFQPEIPPVDYFIRFFAQSVFDHGILLTIRQNRQNYHATFCQAGRHNHMEKNRYWIRAMVYNNV